jgi:hypothetical protein
MYEEEVHLFQASFGKPKVGTIQIVVGDMPWDFWSNMMLQIEALMLDNLITHVEPLCSWKVVKDVQTSFVGWVIHGCYFPSFTFMYFFSKFKPFKI